MNRIPPTTSAEASASTNVVAIVVICGGGGNHDGHVTRSAAIERMTAVLSRTAQAP